MKKDIQPHLECKLCQANDDFLTHAYNLQNAIEKLRNLDIKEVKRIILKFDLEENKRLITLRGSSKTDRRNGN
jgi:hypothetical protein